MNRACIRFEKQNCLRRTLSYQDPPHRPMVRNLRGTILLAAKTVHLSSAPREVGRQICSLTIFREAIGLDPPEIVWQPAHVRAVPVDPEDSDEVGFEEVLKSYRSILRLVSVFSPSYQELEDIAGGVGNPAVSEERDIRTSVETLAEKFPVGRGGDGVLIVRCEPFGYYYRNKKKKGWVKAYSQYAVREPVVDFTGGGSAFLGAYAVARIDGCGLRESCVRGAVAASFAMEQFGLPVKTYRSPGPNSDEGEFWNSDRAERRLRALRSAN
ncbi:Ribokinase-like protein [Xylaria castorea]|nr:Ribokinase-like protein [Xylaria castorea]